MDSEETEIQYCEDCEESTIWKDGSDLLTCKKNLVEPEFVHKEADRERMSCKAIRNGSTCEKFKPKGAEDAES